MTKQINTAAPFFYKKDIEYIIKEFKKILQGKGKLSMGKYVEQGFEYNSGMNPHFLSQKEILEYNKKLD